MKKPLLVEVKGLLTHILNSDNQALRVKTLELVMIVLSETEMDAVKAENALKAELKNKHKEADALIEKILVDVDKEEYSDHKHP